MQASSTKNGATIGKLADVAVGLGTATTANVTVGAMTLEEIQVLPNCGWLGTGRKPL